MDPLYSFPIKLKTFFCLDVLKQIFDASWKGLLSTVIIGFAVVQLSQNWYTNWQIRRKFEKSNSFLPFSKSLNLNNQLENAHEAIEIKRLGLSSIPTENLAIIVGESGIGKTTSICHYAKVLREQGYPVYYFTVQNGKDFSLESFLMKAFGTSNLEVIYNEIEKRYTSKGKTATFIIDNIHYCENDASAILTTLNTTFFQALKMNIIMLSSVNWFAYDMETGALKYTC